MNAVAELAAQVLYLFAPLLVSAALSGIVMRRDYLPRLRYPIDAGRSWRGKRLFGDSKTWRGVVVAAVGSVATCSLQRYVLDDRVGWLAVVDYARIPPVGFGLAMGVGAMAGELPNSFVKRRLGIAPGKTTRGPLSVLFYVWDQVDLLTLSWPLIGLFFTPRPALVVASFAVTLLLHPLVSLIGFLIGARRSCR